MLVDDRYQSVDGDDELSEPVNEAALENAAKLLGCNPKMLQKAVCSRSVIGGRGSVYYRPRTADEAKTSTNAMVKSLYERLFDLLVQRSNQSINGPEDKSTAASSYISVLDIYGFESFDTNTLEQLCINFANEKLQQFFVHNVLAQEQQAYRADGIRCAPVSFQDNQPTVDLIEQAPNGLFGILDEVCKMPQPSDDMFTNKVHEEHSNTGESHLSRSTRKMCARWPIVFSSFAHLTLPWKLR